MRGQIYFNAALPQMFGDIGGDLTDGHFTEFHSGFPFRRGLRLLSRSLARMSSG
jgi:hypothetical protein